MEAFKTQAEIKEELIRQLNEKSDGDIQVSGEVNLLPLGINSINIMKILSFWIKEGYQISFSELIRNPYIDKWSEIIFTSGKKLTELKKKEIADMYQPFPLTDVQYAYWIGRRESQFLGGVGCHGYFEVDCTGLNLEQLSKAWNMLFEYHPMLRARYLEDGTQVIMKEPYNSSICIQDLKDCTDPEGEKELRQIRERLSHRLLNIEAGEVVALQVSIIAEDRYRLHFEIDLLVCDVQSFQIILRDFAAYYRSGEVPAIEKEWNFAQYLQDDKKDKTEKVIQDEQYWKQKINVLPDGPQLPLAVSNQSGYKSRFQRHLFVLKREQIEVLEQRSEQYHVTLAMVLLTAYGMAISNWTENKRFLMNITLFNRNMASDIENVVADFTNLLLVGMDFSESTSFLEHLNNVNNEFLENMDHTAYSGVKVLRDIKKKKEIKANAPVVFSCNLGNPLVNPEFQKSFGDIGYMITQTPQVLIDLQVFSQNDNILLIWDALDDLFPGGLVDEMFGCFTKGVERLADKAVPWDSIQVLGARSQEKRLAQASNFATAIEKEMDLTSEIFRKAEENPSAIAIINPETELILTYQTLAEQARYITGALQNKGIKSGDRVAVWLPRGETFIVSVLGILSCGAVYIPVSNKQPEERIKSILKFSAAQFIITDNLGSDGLKENKEIIWMEYEDCTKMEMKGETVPVSGQDSAYIIFTSGSTGVPKGVEITHQAAMNTIATINQQYQVDSSDRVIGVSASDFDLSVYDIFGMLNQGGSLVVISDPIYRDARRWVEIIKKYKVTIWNSVPTLMKMLMLEANALQEALDTVRLVLLSGDWIDLDIPEKLQRIAPDSQLIAMGGATEAAIWSNYYEVNDKIPADWKSIPYGTSLKNQIYRVVDKHGNDCPDYISGELWIGGLGVAKGYVGDRELTDKKFVMDLNQRWYRTGDLGRFWSDGTIEFLGRMDNQVKVRGHRIELGEIENAIKAYRGIEDTITWITEGKENKQILAAVSLADDWNLLLQQKLVREEKTFPGEQIVRDLRIDVYAGAADDKQMFQAAETIRTIALREILESLKQHRELEILPEYQPIVAGWKAIAEKQSKLEVSSIDDKWLFLDAFVQPFTENILEIISGEINPNHLLLEDNFISPNVITNQMPNGIYIRDMILKILTAAANRAFEDNRKQPLKVLEVGARDLRNTMQFYRSAPNIEYTILDKTQFFIQKAKKELSGLPNVKYCVEDLDNQSDDAKTGSCFDIILLNNTLHQYADVHKILQKLQQQLTAGGLLIFTEMIKELPLQDFTGVFLKADVRDERAVSKKMLFTREEWKKILFGTDMKRIDVFQDSEIDKENFYQELFVLSNQREKEKEQLFEEQSLKTYLLKRLPEYMVPSHIAAVPSIPLTENGKMDRKKLMNDFQEAFHQEEVLEEDAEELTGTEKRLKQLWDDLLHVHTNKNSNYFKMGGDSLLATALAGNIRKEFEIDFSLEIIFQYPILSEMASHIAKADQKDGIIETELPEMIMDSANRYQPFPLTDVQQAYWIGRTDVFNYSQVSTQCYFEMDCDGIDLAAVERSWNLLIAAHDMLRAVILKNGEEQQVIEKADYYHLKNYDLTSVSEAKKDTKLMEVRAEMSIRKYDMHSWPLFDIRTAQYEEDKTRLFISFDNIVLDGFSMFYLFREWKYYYLRPSARIAASDITFRDYVINYEKLKATDAYKKDLIYWENRAREMYPAPELNIKADQLKQARRFERFSERINRTIWSDLKEQLKSYGITPAAFLIGAYAEVIGLWSKNARFSINLTRFNRLKLHEEVDRLIGDFTSLTILGVDTSKGDTFLDRIQAIQNQLWEDLNHPLVSGVVVERLMNQMNGNGAMPVVFTSGLGLEQGMNGQPAGYLGKIHYGLSQTPQVWLDYQVYEEDGELSLSWDALIDIFPEGMVAEMFYAYTGMIHGIHRESRLWEVKTVASTKAPNEELRKALNNTDGEVSEETLIGLFEKAVKQYGEKYLIESDERSLSYGEVDQLANGMAELLQRNKIGKGDIVAIQMKKGWEQIIAVIAILKLGAVYLPLNINNPIQRNAEILESSEAKLLLINEEDGEYQETYVDKLTVLPFAKHQNNKAYCVPVQAEDLAYIIYTSGTTGRPKGVAITHQGAVNTILDVNYRISADHSDKAMVISDISFDLSVYDMFGMMACGGSIVIPDFEKAKEPAHWKALLEQYHVTIWNSVPMFMQMFLSYLQYHPLHGSHSLKYTLLSGDWIPLTIKEEMDKYLNNCKIYGLGGATEASIWSNIFLIEGIDFQWKSIPYGKPLANQRYYIFNEVMQDCPNHVIGDLYIGGLGLAREYWRDQEATRKSFIRHPDTRERLYKTGDLALYRPDGNIEFCGREDDQVKVNGFRIELGEINHYIQQNPSVKQAESIVYQNEIYAVIVADEECIKERIIADLEQVLPEYMIPKKVISVDWIALTANGKVDKKRLYGFIQKELRPNNCVAEALTEREKELKDIWIKIMQCEMLMAEESFLQAGGTSLMAVQIINALNKRYGIELSIKDFYQNATVRQLAQFVEAQLSESELGDI